MFNFQVLQPGDLQKQIALLEAQKPQKDIISDNNLSDEEKAEKVSKVIAEAFDNYLTFYATRLIKLELHKKKQYPIMENKSKEENEVSSCLPKAESAFN